MVERPDGETGPQGKAELARRDHLLVLLPALVLGGAALLLSLAGHPVGTHRVFDGFSGTAEGAARVKMLSAWLLLTALGIGVAAYYFGQLRALGRRTRRQLAVTYGMLAIGGTGIVMMGQPEEAHRFVGEQFVCSAFSTLEEGRDPPVPSGQAKPPADASKPPPLAFVRETSWALSPSIDCPQVRQWTAMRVLNNFQRLLLALVTPALVLGMISSLASGPGVDFRTQAERLNTYLYLASAVMVAGLLFLNALLRWPAFVLPEAPRRLFEEHAGAITLYWGVAYSLFNAAVYLPVAARLRMRRARIPEPRASAPGSGDEARTAAPTAALPDPLLTPVGMLKAGASLFAPALAGLLAGVIKI